MASLDADVVMEPEAMEEEWEDEAVEEEWDDEAVEEEWGDEAMEEWEWEYEAMEEDERCMQCGEPVWFPVWPLCEACTNADDDATTAAGNAPEDLVEDSDWESVFESDGL
jgi:hypothetical protein